MPPQLKTGEHLSGDRYGFASAHANSHSANRNALQNAQVWKGKGGLECPRQASVRQRRRSAAGYRDSV